MTMHALGRSPGDAVIGGVPVTLQETMATRRRKHRRQQNRKQKVRGRSVGIGHNLGPSLAPLLDDRCMTFSEWCLVNSIGERTGRRIIKSGNGPVVTQLSEKRIGITVGNNRAWQQSRARG
jgi:hypothetical protein